MSSPKLEVFHVTPKENRAGIEALGVLPALSRGREKFSWWVTRPKLPWAMAHVSAKHSVPVDSLVVFIEHVDSGMLVRTAWEGVYKTAAALKATHCTLATTYLD